MSSIDTLLYQLKAELLEKAPLSKQGVDEVKRQFVKQWGLREFPRNSDILKIADETEMAVLRPMLRKSDVRSFSGVAVVAVMTKPSSCPHGVCVMCPGGLTSNTPQSYTGHEPAARRALMNAYDPFLQTTIRVKQLDEIGHNTDKVDVIVMGGTFNNNPVSYQQDFIHRIFDALNQEDSKTIQEAHTKNEVAKHRCVGMTVETRPDMIDRHQIDRMLNWGVTRVELGVQTLYDDVFERINRGHTVEDVQIAFALLRDAGLKITAHMMPGLPGNDRQRDLTAFQSLFQDEPYMPDELKIYPLQIVQDTELYDDYLEGKVEPLTNEAAADLIAEIKAITPPFIRIKRILRDIPAHQVKAGPNKGNLRQLAQAVLAEKGKSCACIRCREAGHRLLRSGVQADPDRIEMLDHTFVASGGKEHFISIEDVHNNVLLGFLRLRRPSDAAFRDELNGAYIVRELHVYGRAVSIGKDPTEANVDHQHRGYGKQLLAYAERIAADDGYQKLAIISGVGVREYYKAFGYRQDGPYVSKQW